MFLSRTADWISGLTRDILPEIQYPAKSASVAFPIVKNFNKCTEISGHRITALYLGTELKLSFRVTICTSPYFLV
jgi:hypothetical protein